MSRLRKPGRRKTTISGAPATKQRWRNWLASLSLLVCTCCLPRPVEAVNPVVMYGYFDIGITWRNGDLVRVGRGYNNWLGWRGKEKLDNGVRSFFTAELRFEPDTGNQERARTLMQGETTVGLESDTAGSLRLGRALTPLWQDVWKYEPWINSGLNASLAAYQTGSYSSDGVNDVQQDFADFSRFSDAVFYVSPSYSGWSMHVAGVLDRPDGARRRRAGVALNYAAEPLGAELAFERNANGDSIRFAAASWKKDKLKLMGSFARVTLRGAVSERVALVAGTCDVGSYTFRTGYGKNFRLQHDKLAAGIIQHLSKRTGLYLDLYHERIPAGASGMAVGITHSF